MRVPLICQVFLQRHLAIRIDLRTMKVLWESSHIRKSGQNDDENDREKVPAVRKLFLWILDH